MTPDQLIALFASVGACLSAFATFLTVRQIAKQREASYKPELAIAKVGFEMMADEGFEVTLLSTRRIRNEMKESAEVIGAGVSLPLRNIGLGAAKAISLRWECDLANMVESANQLAQRTLTQVYFSIDDFAVRTKSEVSGEIYSMWKNQSEAGIDYVLPASIDKNPIYFPLPHAYLQLASALIYLIYKDKDKNKNKDKDNDKKLEINLPSLNLGIEFSDIGGIAHQANFIVKLHIVCYTKSEDEGNTISAYIECTKRI
jgi:hypothetical protein